MLTCLFLQFADYSLMQPMGIFIILLIFPKLLDQTLVSKGSAALLDIQRYTIKKNELINVELNLRVNYTKMVSDHKILFFPVKVFPAPHH